MQHSSSSSSLCAICSQQVGCHGSPSFSILCHSDTVIIWYFCPFLDVICPHCSRSPLSSSTIYPSFHQQSLYPISSYYKSKYWHFLFLIVFNNDLLVFILCKTSPLVLCSFHDILNSLLYSHISKASNLSDVTLVSVHATLGQSIFCRYRCACHIFVEDWFNTYLGYLQYVSWCTNVWFMFMYVWFMLMHVDITIRYMMF